MAETIGQHEVVSGPDCSVVSSVVLVAIDIAAVRRVAYRIGAVVIGDMVLNTGAVAMRACCVMAGQVVHYQVVIDHGRAVRGGDFSSSVIDGSLLNYG